MTLGLRVQALTILAAIALVGCDGWEFFDRDAGDTSQGRDYRLQILSIKTCPPPDHEELPKGHERMGIEVELFGGHRHGTPANFFYASLLTPKGDRIGALPDGCTPGLRGPPLRAGERAQGYLNFVVPSGARGLTLEYAPELVGHQPGSAPTQIPLDPTESQTP